MSKVDWINWKTEPKEIIDCNKINSSIEEIYSSFNLDMNHFFYEIMNHEVSFGGLSPTAFNISGTSPLNEKAMKIMDEMNLLKDEMRKFQTIIISNCEEQRKEEKKQLIEAVEEKIKEEEKILENTLKLKEKIQNNPNMQEELKLDDIISVTKDRINKLKLRLDNANQLE